MTAYFDNNVLVYLEEEYFSLEEIINKVNPAIEKVYYSSAHVFEANQLTDNQEFDRVERIEKRLLLIDKITNGNYIYLEKPGNKVYFLTHPAREVFETINEVPFGDSAMKSLLNIISHEQKAQIREILGLESSKLNNYSPKEVVEHLNKNLNQWSSGLSMIGLLETGLKYHPDYKTFGLDNKIAGLFEILDILGYWTDKPTEKSNYARSMDASHTFYASHCDYFVSNDKKTRYKAKVAYSIYNVDTFVPEIKMK